MAIVSTISLWSLFFFFYLFLVLGLWLVQTWPCKHRQGRCWLIVFASTSQSQRHRNFSNSKISKFELGFNPSTFLTRSIWGTTNRWPSKIADLAAASNSPSGAGDSISQPPQPHGYTVWPPAIITPVNAPPDAARDATLLGSKNAQRP